MAEINHEELIKRIENSKFFKKYGCKGWRLCGSSTYIAPITDWVENREIVIEIDALVSHSGMTNAFKALFNELSKDFPLDEWHYNKNDGSCPQEYVIYYV